MDAADSPTRLIFPRKTLASCVRAYIVRSTVEAPLLQACERYNHFPATPHCSLTFFIDGEAEVIAPPEAPKATIRVVFGGPQTRPMVTYNPGPVRMLMVMLYPQALHALCGVDVSAWVDRWASVEQVLDAQWQSLADAVLRAADDGERLALVENFLEPRWQAARPGAGGAAEDWVRHMAAQAADTAFGRGVRNIERRIKARAGQPLRKLLGFQRAELSFFEARDEYLAGKAVWSDIAARGGYSDQAHFCREARKITGHTPLELARVLASTDERYWIYRVWT